MTIRMAADGKIELHGICPIEDAEELRQRLLAAPATMVDWRRCEQAHSAVIQVLLACGRDLSGPPAGDFLRNYLDSVVKSASV